MSRPHFFRIQLLGPALMDDEGTEFARPLWPHNRGTRIASDIRMDEWHSRDADVLVDADGRVIARYPGHRKLQSKFPNRTRLRTRPSRCVPLAGCQLTCLQQHRSTASLSKQHRTWPTNRAMLNQHALSIRLIELRLANRRHTQQISW